jgi:hypothetical protein
MTSSAPQQTKENKQVVSSVEITRYAESTTYKAKWLKTLSQNAL